MVKSSSVTKIVKPLRSGQMTIPAQFREQLGIDADTLLQVTLVGDEMRIRPVRAQQKAAGSPWFLELYKLFAPVRAAIQEQGLTEQEVNDAIDEAVAAVRARHANDRR